MFLCNAKPAAAQAGHFAITIVSPAVDQTLYAGPSSLLYSVQVTGYVETLVPEPSLIKVHLQMLRGSEVTDGGTLRLGQDGTFAFPVTVNPDGSRSDFLIAQIESGCENCHYGAPVSFPAGKLILRVTATDPSGQSVTAERQIVVDRSSYAIQPVRVVSVDSPGRPVANVMVSADTRLYLWRARSSSGITDSSGVALVRVEVLSQAPTRYIFRVAGALADGILYDSVASQDVTFTPGAATLPPITLAVRGQAGQLGGKVSGGPGILPPFPIHAIHLPDGAAYTTQLSASGTFSFTNLPIGSYRIVGDTRTVPGYSIADRDVDLSKAPTTILNLSLTPGLANSIRGRVLDLQGNPLPFGWISAEKLGLVQANSPDSGAFDLSGIPSNSETLVISSPGYYAQAQVAAGAPGAPVDFTLTPRPETRILTWGTGKIVVPCESQVSTEPQNITLTYGWLWGSGDLSALPQRLTLPEASITLQSGQFAIEYLPDVSKWLYVMKGSAVVRPTQSDLAVTVDAGRMIALTDDPSHWASVPLDPIAVAAMHPIKLSPIIPTWEPSLDAQFRDHLAQMGISFGQMTVFLTYLAVLLLFVFVPLLGTIKWISDARKKQRINP